MTWRYTTHDCRRVWRWYAAPGAAERGRALLTGCGRVAVLAMPLALGAAVPGTQTTLPDVPAAALGWGVFPELLAGSFPHPASLPAASLLETNAAVWANLAPHQDIGARPGLPPDATPIPEPATLPLLAGIVLAGLLMRKLG